MISLFPQGFARLSKQLLIASLVQSTAQLRHLTLQGSVLPHRLLEILRRSQFLHPFSELVRLKKLSLHRIAEFSFKLLDHFLQLGIEFFALC
jgi:hypothetical protein